jgi:hypothetical protein
VAQLSSAVERERTLSEVAAAEASTSAKAAASAIKTVTELREMHNQREAELAAELDAANKAVAAAAAAAEAVPPAPVLPDVRLSPCSCLYRLACERSTRAVSSGFGRLALWHATDESRRLRQQAEEHAVAATALAEAIASEVGKVDVAMVHMFTAAAATASAAEAPAN